MSVAERLIALEREGWDALVAGEGGRYYGEHLTDDALMAFSFGVLTRAATIEAVALAPPWERYEIADPRVGALGDDSGIVVYQVVARRPGEEPYSAVASTTYVRHGDVWQVAFHQQSPKP